MATYNKNVWHTGDIITEDKMNNLEDGIETIVTSVNTANTAINDVANSITTLTDAVNTINENVTTINEQVGNINLEDITETLTAATESIRDNREVIDANAQAIAAINTRINRLENHVALFSTYSDTAIIDDTEGCTSVESDKKLVLTNLNITSDESPIWTIQGKSVALQGSTADSTAIRVTAAEDIVISDNIISGALDEDTSHAMVSIDTNETVVVKNCTSSLLGYNGLEIGLNNTAPKRIIIKDCEFNGELSNNAISIFATANNAVVDIINCHFTKVSSVLRISNRTNATGVKINFTNCTWDHLEDNLEYKAVVLCQDYTSASQAETISANRFGNNKIEIIFNNCTGEDGNALTLPEDGSWSGTGEGKLVYVFANKWTNEERGKVPFADYSEMFPDVGVNNNL
jgi:hypothetical protein